MTGVTTTDGRHYSVSQNFNREKSVKRTMTQT
jgi:hypothetical protein